MLCVCNSRISLIVSARASPAFWCFFIKGWPFDVLKTVEEKYHSTILLIFHDFKKVSDFADEIIILKNGNLFFSKSPIDLALTADDYERMIINDWSLFIWLTNKSFPKIESYLILGNDYFNYFVSFNQSAISMILIPSCW